MLQRPAKNKMIWMKIACFWIACALLGEHDKDEIVVPKSSIFLQIYHVKNTCESCAD